MLNNGSIKIFKRFLENSYCYNQSQVLKEQLIRKNIYQNQN